MLGMTQDEDCVCALNLITNLILIFNEVMRELSFLWMHLTMRINYMCNWQHIHLR